MPISNYPFRVTEKTSSPKPVVPVVITNPANGFEYSTWALIDTGADTTVIPENIAKELYHDVRHPKVKRDFSCGIGGDTIVYMHTFSIDILHSDPKGNVNPGRVAIRLPKKEIAVVPGLHMIILGEDDFLKDYVLTIDYPGQSFSIRKPRKRVKAKAGKK